MNRNISKIEESILRMTAAVRQGQAAEIAQSFGESRNPNVRPLGWWVLACGESLADDSFASRENSRERLIDQVAQTGVILSENIWIWDENGTAQLVISTVPSLKRAEKLASHLREKGLVIRILREKI